MRFLSARTEKGIKELIHIVISNEYSVWGCGTRRDALQAVVSERGKMCQTEMENLKQLTLNAK